MEITERQVEAGETAIARQNERAIAGILAELERDGAAECEDCGERHYMDWDLVVGNLRSLLTIGRTRVHEPAYSPDPSRYVSWEYARGYSDGVLEAAEDADELEDLDNLEDAGE